MGTVRLWHDAEGWGIIDSAQTPGGCWAHFSHVAISGHKALEPGREVVLEWEAAKQDGFTFRATRVWPAGTEPVTTVPSVEPADRNAYSSSLSITVDE